MKPCAVAIFLVHFSFCTVAQEQTIDLNEINGLVAAWSDAHNEKDIPELERLYADEVIFYAQRLPRASCLGIKAGRLRSGKYFHQEILTKITITAYSSGILRAAFVKRVTSGDVAKDWDAYLLLKRFGKKFLIVGESDLVTDVQEHFVPKLGTELKVSRLGDGWVIDTDRTIKKAEPEQESNFLLWAVGISGCLIIAGFFLIRRRRSLAVKDPVQSQPDTGEKGRLFEEFIVQRFDKKYFTLLEWQGDKMINGIYPKSSHHPDLVYEFRYIDQLRKFAVECKFRQRLMKNRISLEQRQMENYRNFQKETGTPVYIVVGLGGTPERPRDLYFIPLNQFGSKNEIDLSSVADFYNDPKYNFYFDLTANRIKTFRKVGNR